MKKTHAKFALLILVVLSFVIVASAPSIAEEEQSWPLEYRSCDPAAGDIFDTRGSQFEFSDQKPEGLALPQFTGKRQLFTKMPFGIIPAGYLDIALDSSQETGAFDKLIIDADADRRLDNDTVLTVASASGDRCIFNPAHITIQTPQGTPVRRQFSFTVYQYKNEKKYRNPFMTVCATGFYQGRLTVASGQIYCILIDHNANGTYDDTNPDINLCDYIRIGKKGALETKPLSRYINVENNFYTCRIDSAAGKISLIPAADIELCTVEFPQNISEVSIGGERGIFTIKTETIDKQKIPSGSYVITGWKAQRKDDRGQIWTMRGYSNKKKPSQLIEKSSPNKIDLDTAILASLDAAKEKRGPRAGTYYFYSKTTTSGGWNLNILCDGKRPPAPKLMIRNKDGSYDQSFDFKYG